MSNLSKFALSGSVMVLQSQMIYAGNPISGTTQYLGSAGAMSNGSTGLNNIYVSQPGIITRAYIYQVITGTLGSAQTSSIYIRLNNTTDTLITSSFIQNAALSAFSNTSLSITVAAGDFIEVKWVCPTWTTTPTNVFPNFQIYMQL